MATEEHVAGPWRGPRPPALTMIISPLGWSVSTVNVNNVINVRDDGSWIMEDQDDVMHIIDRIDPVIQIQLHSSFICNGPSYSHYPLRAAEMDVFVLP